MRDEPVDPRTHVEMVFRRTRGDLARRPQVLVKVMAASDARCRAEIRQDRFQIGGGQGKVALLQSAVLAKVTIKLRRVADRRDKLIRIQAEHGAGCDESTKERHDVRAMLARGRDL